MTCTEPDCLGVAKRAGLCWECIGKRRSGTGKFTAATEPPAIEQLREAALSFADADTDDDRAFRQADDRLRHSAKIYARRSHKEAVRSGLAEARARGVRLGPPRMLEGQRVADLVRRLGVLGAARVMGCSRITVWREVKGVSRSGSGKRPVAGAARSERGRRGRETVRT